MTCVLTARDPRRWWLRRAIDNVRAAARCRELAERCERTNPGTAKALRGWAMDYLIDADEFRQNARDGVRVI